jgi:DNA-binding transcriptional LysR family regulator
MHLLSVFLAVGETQGFASAAHRLGLSPAAISRAISSLETELGVELIRRTTRNVRLTDAGKRYLADIKDIVQQVAEVNDAASVTHRGTLVVAAPELFARSFVMPCIAEYLGLFPDVDVVGYFFDRIINLLDEKVDVAVGIASVPAPGLLAIPVGHVRPGLWATPAYLDKHGTPEEPADLAYHTLIAVGGDMPLAGWKFEFDGSQVDIVLRPRVIVTSDDTAIAAAARGLGVVRAFTYQVSTYLADGTLNRVLARYDEAARPVYVLCREDNVKTPKVSDFRSLLMGWLRAHKDLQ